MTRFNVIDSLMGSGKTQYVIQYVNAAPEDMKFIYITPYLDEVERFKTNVTSREVFEPSTANREGTKLEGLKVLIRGGFDIASTHALLQTADREVVELLQENNYHLIIDEALDVIETVDNMTAQDIQILKSLSGLIETDEKGAVKWCDDQVGKDSVYQVIYLLANAGTLYVVNDVAFVKIFSDEILRSFETVTVCSYLFKYSQMRMYYDMLDIEYTTHSVKYNDAAGVYELIEYNPLREDRKTLYQLMNVYEGKYNDNLSDIKLSSSKLRSYPDFPQGREKLDAITSAVRQFFRAFKDDKEGACYWTTLECMYDYIRPQGYKSDDCKISLNARATNQYSDGYCMAYIYDRYPNPVIKQFFTSNGVEYDSDGWAVADVLQWIYRGRIRNGKDIQLFMPAKRMRKILKQWSKYEI